MTNFTTILLLNPFLDVIIPIGVGVICLILGLFAGLVIVKKARDKKIGSTEKVVQEMLSKAEEECRALKKEAIVEIKEQELKLRRDFENESREKRAEFQRIEQRLNQKDEILNKYSNIKVLDNIFEEEI